MPIFGAVWREQHLSKHNLLSSIKNAFYRDFPSAVIHNILKYCEAFDVLTKVSKFIFVKEQVWRVIKFNYERFSVGFAVHSDSQHFEVLRGF